MNNRAKGNKKEKEVEQLLQSKGYITHRNGIGGRWDKNRDIFHLFDIVGILKKQGKGIQEYPMVYIQVKSQMSDFYKARKEIIKFLDNTESSLLTGTTAFGVIIDQSYLGQHKTHKWRLWLYKNKELYLEEI